jgi:hypothetical protein
MNALNRPGIYAGFASLVLMSAVAAPALAQTKTFPAGTDCSTLSGADMTACQAQMASQQKDGTVGNGATPNTPADPGGIGTGNLAVPNNAANPNGGNANGNGADQNTGVNRSGANGGTGSPNATTNNTSNP